MGRFSTGAILSTDMFTSGATDILEAYFAKIGGRPSADKKGNSAKKRGRKSNASTTETPEPNSKRSKTGFEGRRGRPAKGASNEDLKWPDVTTGEWTPPKPTKDAWEDLIVSIETIEVEENGTKWAFLLWSVEDENGKKRTSKAHLKSVYTAAPQAVRFPCCFVPSCADAIRCFASMKVICEFTTCPRHPMTSN